MESNVVSVCYVVQEKLDLFTYPVIYLEQPKSNHNSQIVHMFYNVFDAKNFIHSFMFGGVAVMVSKYAPEEELEQICL